MPATGPGTSRHARAPRPPARTARPRPRPAEPGRPAPVDLSRLLAPRSIAVVGASTRPGSYGNQAVANLVEAGFTGTVHGVHPTATAVHGVPCVPRLAELPAPPDAVVIATPAATVPGLLDEA